MTKKTLQERLELALSVKDRLVASKAPKASITAQDELIAKIRKEQRAG